MSGVYSVEDLLKLRNSPLVSKPASLPPIEEWMGTQEPAAKRPNTRGKQDEPTVNATFQKRNLLDPASRKPASDANVVLGPPRRSFASSSGRPFARLGAFGSEDTFKERSGQPEKTRGEGLDLRPNDRRAGHNGGISNLQRRRYDEEEGDGKRREHERRADIRDSREDRALEDSADDTSFTRAPARRDQNRAKFEQPWFRGDKPAEDKSRDNERTFNYRRERVRDGDWDMPSKNEVDPEWMESLDTPEHAQARTQEDFQRWKERMKAGSNAVETPTEPAMVEPNTANRTEGLAPLLPNPILADSSNSMDKFFARFSERAEENATAKPAAKTRFASIFGQPAEPKPEPQPALIENVPIANIRKSPEPVITGLPLPPPPPPQPQNDADQAGFQRILQMLGRKNEVNAESSRPKSSQHPIVHNTQQRGSPDLMALFRQDQPARHTPTDQPPAPSGIERLLESRSPIEGHSRQTSTPNRDELLLNLLQRAEISSNPPQQQVKQQQQRPPMEPFWTNFFEEAKVEQAQQAPVNTSRTAQQHDAVRASSGDSAIHEMSQHEDLKIREHQQRRPTNGTGYGDPFFDMLRGGMRHENPAPAPQQLPPGLQRPPGLSDMSRAPPGWEQQLRGPGQVRPGQPPALGRGLPPGLPLSQQPPMPMQPPQQLGQGPPRTPQRKYTGESGAPNFPPGMGPPPPGFMAVGPPPGFHHGSDAGAAQSYGRYAMGGTQQPPQQQVPANPNRNYMDVYTIRDRGDLRGGGNNGVALPPGFR